jgi:hypothetical protein
MQLLTNLVWDAKKPVNAVAEARGASGSPAEAAPVAALHCD